MDHWSLTWDAGKARRWLSQAVELLSTYAWLTDSFILEFFVEDHWNQVALNWREVLESWDFATIAKFLSPEEVDTTWPSSAVPCLSLLSFRAVCHSLCLPRQSVSSPEQLLSSLRSPSSARRSCESRTASLGHEWKLSDSEQLSAAAGQLSGLRHEYRRHVKPKKQHEVGRLSALIAQLSPPLVVDVGSGQGHLARYLAYHHQLPVVAVDAVESHVHGARKFDDHLEAMVRKRSNGSVPEGPQHVTLCLDGDAQRDCLSQHVLKQSLTAASDGRFMLVGLHACGDLSAWALRQLVASERCTSLALVSCCYMKLSTDKTHQSGYPMSRTVSECAAARGYRMSYAARELSCHALEAYVRRLCVPQEQCKLQVHAYRAALERVLVGRDASNRRAGARGVKHADRMTFEEYARLALRNTEMQFSAEELAAASVDLQYSRRVVLYFSLRLLLAPVVESVLLLDRLMYLNENGVPCALAPIFDPLLSPRNCVIVAVKNNV